MINVVILEDQRLLRQSLVASLGGHRDISVSGAFANGEAMLGACETLRDSHVGLLDIRLENGTSFHVVEKLKLVAPKLRLLWVSSIEQDALLEQAFKMPIHGFFHKEDSMEALIEAIFAVAAGKTYFSNSAVERRNRLRSDSQRFSLILSDREQEVLKLIGAGFSNAEAASVLGLSAATVKAHRRNIMARVGVHRSVELQAYALRIGLTDPRELKLE
jgi:DNA-binding NarL/FixJ family response regulator